VLSTVARSSADAAAALALLDGGALVRLRCMRGAVYAVPRIHLPTVYGATAEQVRKGRERGLRWAGITPEEGERLRQAVPEALAGRQATVAELRELLPAPSPAAAEHLAILASSWAADGLLVRGATRGGWRDGSVAYGLAVELLPDVRLDELEERAARAGLARLYLAGFGPATLEDFGWWSGLGKRAAALAFADLLGEAPPATQPVDLDPPAAPGPSGEEPLRLVPAWDTYLVGYRDRTRQARAEHLPWLYDAAGNSTSAVLHEGVAVGLWQLVEGPPPVVAVAWLPGVRPPRAGLAAAEAARLGERLALDGEASVQVVELPPPLAQQRRNAHLAPLGPSLNG
jgi:hypothetical protein